MKKALMLLSLLFLSITIAGCLHQQQIPPPVEGTNQNKIQRFYYMQDNWSYLNNNWIISKRITPYNLEAIYKISDKEAQSDVSQFIMIQKKYNGFERFLISVDLYGIRFYIE